MTHAALPLLDAAGLLALASESPQALSASVQRCESCAPLVCPGWESIPSSFDAKAQLRPVATLRRPDDDDPTLAELHPQGTNSWSVDAPIAPAWFPYNRCEVWRCVRCTRHFLRYTEYGGYYQDERIRELNPALVVDQPVDQPAC